MKFPLKSKECSEIKQFPLLLEQATNKLPSAGIIKGSSSLISWLLSYRNNRSLGRCSKWNCTAVSRFDPQQHQSTPVLEKHLSSEGLWVFSRSLRLCTGARHLPQREAATGTLEGTGSICIAESSWIAVPCSWGGSRSQVSLSSCGHVSHCLQSVSLLLCKMLAPGSPWVLGDAPVFPSLLCLKPWKHTMLLLYKKHIQILRHCHTCTLTSIVIRWTERSVMGEKGIENLARLTIEIMLSLWQQIHSWAASVGLENNEMRP